MDASLLPLLSFAGALPGMRPSASQVSHPIRGRRHLLASDLREALEAAGPAQGPGKQNDSAWQVTSVGHPPALAGAHQDWVEMSPPALQLWERQALGPYGYAKNVSWLALAPPDLVASTELFLQSLDQSYSACNLGQHVKATLQLEERWVVGVDGAPGRSEDVCLSRVVEVPVGAGSRPCSDADKEGYAVDDFLKGLGEVCEKLQRALWRNGGPKFRRSFPADGSWLCEDHNGGEHFFVVYVVCPFDAPDAYAEVMAEALRLLAPVTSPWLVSPLIQTGESAASISCPAKLEKGFTSMAQGRARHVERVRSVSALQMLSRFVVLDSAERFLRGTALSVYHKLRRPEEIKSWPGSAPLPSTPLPGTPASPGQYTMGGKGSPASPSDEKPEQRPPSAAAKRAEENLVRKIELMHEPAFILAHPYPPSQNPYKDLKPDEREPVQVGKACLQACTAARYALGARPLQHWIHCCYSVSPGLRGATPWLLAAWTDSRGELLETQATPLISAPSASPPGRGGEGDREGDAQPCRSVNYPALCSKILSTAAQIVSSALKASHEEVDLRHVAVVRLGDMEDEERGQWQRVLGSCGGRDGDGEAYGLTSIAVGSLTAQAPLDLNLWESPAPGPAHLLQLGPQALEGPGRLMRCDSGAPGGNFVWIAWTPSASEGGLLPGEDLWARVSRFSLMGQRGRGPGVSTPLPETPATPSDGSPGKGKSAPAAAVSLPQTLAAEMNSLASCSAAFHGLVTGCGDSWWRSNLRWRSVHGDTAHLPLHCKVVENMHVLLGTLGPVLRSGDLAQPPP